MTEVIAGACTVLASNAIMEWHGASVRQPSPSLAEPNDRAAGDGGARWRPSLKSVSADAPDQPPASGCANALPVAAVMLHLRSCYVSKAAILTIPVQPVPVENRSPA